MKRVATALLLACCFTAPALAAFDRDAQMILGAGRWGLVEGSGTASNISDARKCDKTVLSFAFSEHEIQRIVSLNGAPPAGPPDSFAAVKLEKGVTVTTVTLFTHEGDALPASTYSYDSIGQTLSRTDALTPENYALCK